MKNEHLMWVGADQKKYRDKDDFYGTPEYATKSLLKREKFGNNILEPCCGDGAISKLLEREGYNVTSIDIIDRGYGVVENFFFHNTMSKYDAVITNPPYKHALDFIKKSLSHVNEGAKVAMLLKLVFLESSGRYNFFMENPPKKIYVFSKRLIMLRGGKYKKHSGVLAFAWYIWEKGFKGNPEIFWINDDYKNEKEVGTANANLNSSLTQR